MNDQSHNQVRAIRHAIRYSRGSSFSRAVETYHARVTMHRDCFEAARDALQYLATATGYSMTKDAFATEAHARRSAAVAAYRLASAERKIAAVSR